MPTPQAAPYDLAPDTEERIAPLKRDIRQLGDQLGKTLRSVEGEAFFETEERVRLLAKEARENGDEAKGEELRVLLDGLPIETAVRISA